MIFATVGHQMPFDRMVKIIDEWAGVNPEVDIFAQIGKATYRPAHIDYSEFLTPQEYDRRIRESNIVIAHAGTGTIIKSLEYRKPIILMARESAKGETRNDHQLYTIELLAKRNHIHCFSDISSLDALLKNIPEYIDDEFSLFASNDLLDAISNFVAQ